MLSPVSGVITYTLGVCICLCFFYAPGVWRLNDKSVPTKLSCASSNKNCKDPMPWFNQDMRSNSALDVSAQKIILGAALSGGFSFALSLYVGVFHSALCA